MTPSDRFIRLGYLITVLLLTLSGFAQMPIFKRYYIADIPGLGWLARFYVTHAMHYGFAALLIGLACYTGTNYLLDQNKGYRITAWGWAKTGVLLMLILSGALMVYKNLTGTPFSPTTVSILNVFHLGLCMLLLILSAYTALTKKKWGTFPIQRRG